MRNVGLAHMLQRGVNGERIPFGPRLGAKVGERLECGDEIGAAIGIARIIKRIDPDEQVARSARFGPCQREAQKYRVARRHIG